MSEETVLIAPIASFQELRALTEDGRVHLVELHLVPEPPVTGGQHDWHGNEHGDQPELPAENERNHDTANDGKDTIE